MLDVAVTNYMISFGEIHVSTNQISGLKHLTCRKYSFQKLTEFSQGNNVQDDPESNIHGFLWRDTCVSSSQLNRPIWRKQSQPQP
jgi:hypothetical protein